MPFVLKHGRTTLPHSPPPPPSPPQWGLFLARTEHDPLLAMITILETSSHQRGVSGMCNICGVPYINSNVWTTMCVSTVKRNVTGVYVMETEHLKIRCQPSYTVRVYMKRPQSIRLWATFQFKYTLVSEFFKESLKKTDCLTFFISEERKKGRSGYWRFFFNFNVFLFQIVSYFNTRANTALLCITELLKKKTDTSGTYFWCLPPDVSDCLNERLEGFDI